MSNISLDDTSEVYLHYRHTVYNTTMYTLYVYYIHTNVILYNVKYDDIIMYNVKT